MHPGAPSYPVEMQNAIPGLPRVRQSACFFAAREMVTYEITVRVAGFNVALLAAQTQLLYQNGITAPLRAAGIFQLNCRLEWAQPFGAASTKLHQNNIKGESLFTRHYHAAYSQCKYTHLLVEDQVVLSRHVHKIVRAVPILQCQSIVQAEKQGYLSITFHKKCHIGRLEASPCTPLLLFSTWKSIGIFCCGFDLYKLAVSALQTVLRGAKRSAQSGKDMKIDYSAGRRR